jgi:hypothetical protein
LQYRKQNPQFLPKIRNFPASQGTKQGSMEFRDMLLKSAGLPNMAANAR